jgi:photosystem II stability/assembly factor-like uncharacterized protein
MIRTWRSFFKLMCAIVAVSLCCLASCRNQPQTERQPAKAAQGWKVIGPGGGGGIFLPTINPFDPKNVLVHCDMTGAYVAYDGGENWREFNLWTVPTDFKFDPVDSKTIYASTRGYLYSEDRGAGFSLLFRSIDCGQRWRIIYPDLTKATPGKKLTDRLPRPFETPDGMLDGTIDKVEVDPLNNRKLYLGVAPLIPYMGGQVTRGRLARLLISTDRGENWNLLAEIPGSRVLEIIPGSLAGHKDEVMVFTEKAAIRVNESTGEQLKVSLPVERITAVKAGKGDRAMIYLMAPLKHSKNKVIGGIYRSDDWGAGWVQVNEGLLDQAPQGNAPEIRALAVCQTRPEVAYLSRSFESEGSSGKPVSNYAILKTENAGNRWSPVYLADSKQVLSKNYTGSWLDRSYNPGWGGSPIDLGVAPSNPDICFATDAGRAYRTLNGGRTWEQVYSHDQTDGSVTSSGLDVTTCYGVHFDPFDKNHFFISYTDIGLFHTFNGGKSWYHSIKGVPEEWINTCYWLEFDPQVRGRAWSAWAYAHDLPRDKMFGARGLGWASGGVAVTDDSGHNWRKSGKGLPEKSICTHVLLDPESPPNSRTLYVCVFERGVYKSTDDGKTWYEANQGLQDNRYAWQMRRNSKGELFLVLARGRRGSNTVDGELFVSKDKAASWQPLPLPEGVNAPHDLEIDPSDPQRMYLSCWTRGMDGKDVGGGLCRTEDGGKTWKRIFDESMRVNSAAIDLQNPRVIYFNTFKNAAFHSEDGGETWKRLEGYRFKWGQRPNLNPSNPDLIYLTTYGGSVFSGPSRGVPGTFEDIENLPEDWR